jgi:GPH family glycoside/pentoside/hexuronide:cation symporter/probable glucitol transport protein GutA
VFPVQGVAKVLLCLVCYIGAGMAYTALCVTYGGLVNLIARDSQVRMNYTTARAIGSGIIHMVLSAVAMPMILYFSRSDVANARGYFFTALVCSLALLPCFWLCAWKCKETVHLEVHHEVGEKKPVFASLKKLMQNKYLMITVFCVFAGACGAIARMSMLSYYIIYVVGSFTMIAPVYTTMTCFQLLGSFALPWGTKTFGKRNYLLILSAIQIVSLIIMFLIPANNPVFLIGISAVIGITMCSGNICTGMLSDCIEYGDYQFGIR